MASSITAANAVLVLGVTNLYDTPQLIQEFSADDVFTTEVIDAAEDMMGVDGNYTGGFVYVPVPWTVTLMADSPDNDFFDNWYAQQQVAQDLYYAFGTVSLPSIGTSWNMVRGILRKYAPIGNAKKVLQPRQYTIHWSRVQPAGI